MNEKRAATRSAVKWLVFAPISMIMGLFLVFFAFSTASMHSYEGIPCVMYHGVKYTASFADESHDAPPEGYTYAGSVARTRSSDKRLKNDFEGFCCSIGAKIYADPDNSETIYVTGNGTSGRNPGVYAPYVKAVQ